jgi:hypothetical protein
MVSRSKTTSNFPANIPLGWFSFIWLSPQSETIPGGPHFVTRPGVKSRDLCWLAPVLGGLLLVLQGTNTVPGITPKIRPGWMVQDSPLRNAQKRRKNRHGSSRFSGSRGWTEKLAPVASLTSLLRKWAGDRRMNSIFQSPFKLSRRRTQEEEFSSRTIIRALRECQFQMKTVSRTENGCGKGAVRWRGVGLNSKTRRGISRCLERRFCTMMRSFDGSSDTSFGFWV